MRGVPGGAGAQDARLILLHLIWIKADCFLFIKMAGPASEAAQQQRSVLRSATGAERSSSSEVHLSFRHWTKAGYGRWWLDLLLG